MSQTLEVSIPTPVIIRIVFRKINNPKPKVNAEQRANDYVGFLQENIELLEKSLWEKGVRYYVNSYVPLGLGYADLAVAASGLEAVKAAYVTMDMKDEFTERDPLSQLLGVGNVTVGLTTVRITKHRR
ncbi:hypothetical protein TSTA_108840 [Talaromyces stipitatus ATCC 10500]|uniref:Uncharacterized protein n=1 Tax=Talaromyces stipitatus (strain ATCC 10500 / CBS 375.48 / QM 6759 / NRRL 1006) TaxID=441959 RepID=B8MUN4_TALSN|nr:uncharacterized protein TSTA_108840 [Talaromyces stipitatus ATCC 10500]EED11702.1 hypothetical protein TSTA_108840 [Talaromyces stipitatus ATCC 10500]